MSGSNRPLNPGRLIAVYPRKISRFRFCPYAQQFLKSVPRNASIDCTGRMRRIPIIFDEFICLTMTTQDACIACVNPPRFQPGGDDHIRVEREIFLGKYEAMDKEDLKVCFNVKLDDVITTFGELFKCVFCYKAFGLLLRDLNKLKLNWPDFFKFQDHPDPLACLTPFVIGDKEIYIDHKHLTRNKAIADLFCVRMPRIYEEVLYETKGAAPCGLHDANAMNYANKLQVWSDAWKIMEPPSRRAVLEIPYSLMVGGITSFVAQHMMCENCEINIYKALLYLFFLEADDTKPEDKENTDGNPRLFDSIEICKDAEFPFNYKTFAKKDLANFKNFLTVTHDFHIHIAESEKFVRHLMYLIDPEIDTKVTVERRTASNLIGGQNALVLVIGLLLFRRLQWIWEKYRETKVSIGVLSYTILTIMRTAFEDSYEKNKGISDLDRICKEIEEEEPKKESKSSKRRAKKKKSKKNATEAQGSQTNNDENDKNAHNIEEANKEASCSKELSKAPQEGEEEVHEIISQEEPNLCEVQSGNTNSREDKKEEISSDHRPKNLHSNGPPQPSPQIRPIDDPFLESFSLLSPNFSILSLNESLDDLIDNDEHDKGIPEEDIKNFQESVPDVLSKREELRQCLKNRFEELCKTVSKGE
ncbi:gametogenetin-binding protein 2-like [Lepeophtheirus salmonis]|uniref:gametogenetin-binding protein 2-like n=1 Tax=Lepeophtheirus salmonis TaxID=72036 RepID=UPI003AF3CF9E